MADSSSAGIASAPPPVFDRYLLAGRSGSDEWVLAEWANTAAAAILFMRNPPSPRIFAEVPEVVSGLPVTYAVLFITAPNAEHQWVAVQRYIRKMSPEEDP